MTTDPCCGSCRGAHGICRSRWACQHHQDAQAQDDANHRARRTHRDPTGNQAAARADRARRKGEKLP